MGTSHLSLSAVRFAAAIAAVASVTACSAGSQGLSPIAAGSVPHAVYAAAACPSAVVAITADYTAAIELYDPSNLSAGPCGHIGGFQSARGLFYDSKGDLWVTDSTARQIYEFAPGAKTPMKTLNDPSGMPLDVTVDEAGKNVYVIDYQNENDATALVEVYENGSSVPSRTLGDPAARNGAFGAVDNQGNLYVTFMTKSNLAQVDRFAGGTGTPENLGLKLVSAGAIVTTKTGALAVCDPYAYRCGIFERGEQKMSHVFGHMGRGGNDAIPNKPPISASRGACARRARTPRLRVRRHVEPVGVSGACA